MGKRHGIARAVIALAILLAWNKCAFALNPSLDVSQYAHTAWKVRDGFAQGGIHAIAQTSDGYLWLGTEFGLLRFDGVRAVPWQPPHGEQLPSNLILDLLVSHDGTLWIGTSKGLASWKDGKLREYPKVAEALIGLFLEDREQTVWFGVREASKSSLCAIRKGDIECYGTGTFGTFVNHLYEDHEGNLWFASATGLWRWAPGPPQRYAFPRGVTTVLALAEDDSGALLIATDHGLKRLIAGRIEPYLLPAITAHFTPTAFLRSRDGSLWVGTSQGLLHMHQGKGDRFSPGDGLSGDFVSRIFEDGEGNVWVLTQDGLDRFREYAIPTISRNQGLSNSATWAEQATPDGSIWICTAEGLNRWANGQMTIYRGRGALVESRPGNEAGFDVRATTTEIANSGLVGNPRSLGLDDRGRLWTSTGDGVFYFERSRFVRAAGVPGGNIFSIAGDGRGKVWILEIEHLFYWYRNAVREIPWSQFGQKTGRAMLPGREPGGLWLGFWEGGVVYLKDGKVVRAYGAGDGLGDGHVTHLRSGSNGGLWASTEGGLSRIKDGHITTLSSKNGLPCNEVHWSMEDDDHAVWLYMPCGLVRMTRSELDAWINHPNQVVKTTVFDNSDGVRSVGLYGSYGPHVTKSPDGRIWFVPNDGVSVIDSPHLPFNKLPPPVHIEQIIADHKSYDASADSSGRVSLPPHVRDLQIDYTALSLVAPEKVLFRYKLEGWDRDWQDVGTRRQAFYGNLPASRYTFRVKACNNSGVWNDAGTSLNLFVAAAYYQTWWFRSACVLAFVGLLGALHQLRLRQVAQQFSIRMEGRVAERTRIARDLHDTLLQSFQGVSLKLYAITYLLPDRGVEARKKLEEVIEQARNAVSEGRDTVQGLRSSTLPANETANAISMFADQLAAEHADGKLPQFRVQVEGTPRDLAPVLRDEVYRIGCEALRNAFRHADATRIEVEIHYDPRRFRLRVRDNGKGIAPEILKAGRVGHYGMASMHERAKGVGGKVAVWSQVSSGTEIELIIPASMAYPKSPVARRSA